VLSPMFVQYLVGLCCVRRNPDAVEVMVGNLVLDEAAGKERDVDATVTLAEADGSVRAFKAYEVKRERGCLDVTEVEQLVRKLADMPSITGCVRVRVDTASLPCRQPPWPRPASCCSVRGVSRCSATRETRQVVAWPSARDSRTRGRFGSATSMPTALCATAPSTLSCAKDWDAKGDSIARIADEGPKPPR
jgi:hypothetical protein